MATRSTPLPAVFALALAATATLAGAAHACDAAKSASAMSACGAVKSRTASAVAKPVATKPAASATAALPALAAPAAAAPAPFASLPNFTQPVVAGLMAFIDPETGMLTGPISELQVPGDLSNAFGPAPDLTPTPLAGGGFTVDLQGTLQDYYVMTIDPLGRRSIRCVQDARHAHTHTHTHAHAAPVAPVAPAPTLILPIAER